MSLLLLHLLAASPLPSVTLLTSECSPTLTNAIRDELEAAGLPTQLEPDGGALVAQVLVRCEGSRVVARVEDRVTAKLVERSLELQAAARGEVLLAIQIVELLHASLAETRYSAVAPVPPGVEQFLKDREPAGSGPWEFAASAGATYAPGGFGVQPSVTAEVSRSVQSWPAWRLELGALLAATVRASTLNGTGGQADVGLIEPRALLAAAWESAGWSARARLSLGVLLVWAVGRASGVYGAATELTGTFEVGLGFSASRTLTQWLSLRLGVDAALAPIPVQVVLPESTTRIGAPLFTFQLGLVFR